MIVPEAIRARVAAKRKPAQKRTPAPPRPRSPKVSVRVQPRLPAAGKGPKPATPPAKGRQPDPPPPRASNPPPGPKPPKTPAKVRDPLADEVDVRFKPAYDALEKERVLAAADRDAAARDRAAFETWAQADRDKRIGLLKTGNQAANEAVAQARAESDARLREALDRAMGQYGAFGRSTGLDTAAAGADAARGALDVADQRAAAQQAAQMERATGWAAIDRAAAETSAARALGAYNKRITDLDTRRGDLDLKKSDALQTARSDQAKLAAEAEERAWMRAYLSGKEQNDFAVDQARLDVQMRGQDITAETADENRAAAAAKDAAKTQGGYKGRTAAQYRSLVDGWTRKAAGALSAKPNTTPEQVRAEGLRHLDVMVAAGVRPSDAARIVDTSTGGGLLTTGDYLTFLQKHLPPANARGVMNQVFGTPLTIGAAPGAPADRQPGARKVIERGKPTALGIPVYEVTIVKGKRKRRLIRYEKKRK